jgi:Sulfite exporter TauE/SafE
MMGVGRFTMEMELADDTNHLSMISSLSSSTFSESMIPIIWPVYELVILTAMWAVYASFTISAATELRCSGAYDALTAVAYVPLLITLTYASIYIPHKQGQDMASVAVSGDVNFRDIPILTVCGCVFVIGILSSLLGIGGGELLGPVLLSLQIMPTVSTATTSVLEAATSLITILSSIATGILPYDTACIFLAVGIVGGAIGRTSGLWYAEKYGRGSVLIFVLVAVLLLAQIEYIDNLATSTSFAVQTFCET